MKKVYTKPKIEVINVECEDVISCSCGRPGNHHGHHKPGGGGGNNGNGNGHGHGNNKTRTDFYDSYNR